MPEVNENSTCYLTVEPKDKDGAAAAPASGTFEVHDLESLTELVAATALTPSSSMEITLSGPIANVLQNSANTTEQRKVTIRLYFGVGDELNDEYIYTVNALDYVP
jgi:hypothetical protein